MNFDAFGWGVPGYKPFAQYFETLIVRLWTGIKRPSGTHKLVDTSNVTLEKLCLLLSMHSLIFMHANCEIVRKRRI